MTKQVKRTVYGTLIGLLVVGIGIMGIRMYSQQRALSDQTQMIQQLQQEKKQGIDRLAQSQTKLTEAQKALDTKEVVANNDKTSERYKRFSDVLSDYFTKMNTYTPDSYGGRKDQVKDELTTTLFNRYFSNKQTIEDSNQMSSRSKSVKVFTKAYQEGTAMEGIVVASFDTSSDHGETWNPGKTLFQVTYDPQSEKISVITTMGDSFTGDMLQ
ncbi:hypothetical protein [Enterococcus gilvus]|uniref:hypothetical protein n=1 Tax=Enterococcus gilvus TaxID=160453 RepID=UPI003EDB3117